MGRNGRGAVRILKGRDEKEVTPFNNSLLPQNATARRDRRDRSSV